MNTINDFHGDYRFLSNFWPAKVQMYDLWFDSVENAYQAAKESKIDNMLQYRRITPGAAKRLGKKATLRPDWNTKRLLIMEELVRRKFAIPHLREKLITTGDAELIEGNHWHDTFWGVCNGKGENNLGKILMKIRSEIQGEHHVRI